MCPLGGSLTGGPGHFWNRGLMVCHCLLVETDQGLVLVDTGMSEADLGSPSRLPKSFRFLTGPVATSETALSHVQRLGFSASDVRHVFPTHLDLDHAGGMVDFPQATVHIYDREFKAAMSPMKKDRARYLAAQWAHEPTWKLHPDPDGETWFGFEAVKPIAELADDLALVPLTGHSAGHCGIAIRGSDTWFLHAGDAFFHRNELDPNATTPVGTSIFEFAVENDRGMRLHNLRRLQDLHAAHSEEVRVLCSHDPEMLEALQRT